MTKYAERRAYNLLMQVIYVDSLFFLNLCIDYLLCLVSARVCGLVLKRSRYLLSALIGAGYSVAVFLPVQRASFRKVNGPMMTGLVSMPRRAACLKPSRKASDLSLTCISSSSSGTM